MRKHKRCRCGRRHLSLAAYSKCSITTVKRIPKTIRPNKWGY